MVSLLLALIGLPVGLALDALVTRFAAAPEDDDEEPAAAPALPAARGAESGSLVIEHSAQVWVRRGLIVATTVGLFAIAGGRFDAPSDLAIVALYISALIVCAATDLLSFRVPNAVTYPALAGALLAGAVMPDADIAHVLAGGALMAGVFLLPALFTGGVGMGMGDVKLAAFVGLALALPNAAPALLLTALAGGAVALFLLATGLRKRGEPIPYAPFISVGALVVLLWQGPAFANLS